MKSGQFISLCELVILLSYTNYFYRISQHISHVFVTLDYGKTSIKNILAQVLNTKAHKSPTLQLYC